MNFNYDKLPKRGKLTSDGVKVRDCKCGFRMYVFYEEDSLYNLRCEMCSITAWIKTTSNDKAILKFNENR